MTGSLIDDGLVCLNCSESLLGDFCWQCGQAATVRRYQITTLVADIYREGRKIDLYTTAFMAWQLFLRPGKFVNDYLAGKRVGYINPIKFFFYAFVAETFIRGFLIYATGDKSFSNIAASDVWFQVTDLLATVFLGFIWFLFYRKSSLNAVECSVAALLFQAESNLLASALLLLTFPLQSLGPIYIDTLKTIDVLLAVGYSYFFAYQLFPGSKLSIVIKQTIIVAIFLVVIVVALVIQMAIRNRLLPSLL